MTILKKGTIWKKKMLKQARTFLYISPEGSTSHFSHDNVTVSPKATWSQTKAFCQPTSSPPFHLKEQLWLPVNLLNNIPGAAAGRLELRAAERLHQREEMRKWLVSLQDVVLLQWPLWQTLRVQTLCKKTPATRSSSTVLWHATP